MKSRREAHLNSFLIALAFTGFVAGLASIAKVHAYWQTNPYSLDVSERYTDWDHPAWMQLDVTAYNSGSKLGAVDCDIDYGNDNPPAWEVIYTDYGVTKVTDYVKIAWADFYCAERVPFLWWWVLVRDETPQMNQRIEYHGEGVFSFETWCNA